MNGHADYGQQFHNNGMPPRNNIIASGMGEYVRPAWAAQDGQAPKAMALRLPPLEEPIQRSFALPEPPPQPRLEPIYLAGAMAAAQTAQASSSRVEERLMLLEQRTINAERASGEVGRAFDIQNQRVLALTADLTRGAAEVNDLRLRYEHSVATNGALQQQVAAFASELREYDNRLQGTSVQLQEALRVNADMRSHMARMNDDMARAAQERSFAASAIERLNHALAINTAAVAEDSRRALEEANAAYRMEAGRRQEQHLMELATLNRDVEMFRQEAAAAGAALHSNIERLNARLFSEEAELNHLRQETARAANEEAAQLGGVRAQCGELQNILNGMRQALQAEQGARVQDAEAWSRNIMAMKNDVDQNQDLIIRRLMEKMENKANDFARLMNDLDAKTADRDEQTRATGEQQLVAFVKGSAKKERAGLERILVLESAMRDVAAAAQMSLNTLNSRINDGMAELAMSHEANRRGSDEREAALRDEINTALQKVRAYARDMEESLEQERIRLEEVVKMEIKARMSATESMKEQIAAAAGTSNKVLDELHATQKSMHAAQGELADQAKALRRDVDKVQEEVTVKVVKQLIGQIHTDLAAVNTAQAEAKAEAAAESESRKKGDEALRAQIGELAQAVQASLENEISEVRAEVDKVGKDAADEKFARQQLSELVETHSEVFVDVQNKLDGQDQKVKTVAAQLTALYEEVEEKVAQLEEKDVQLTQELAATRTEVVDLLMTKLEEQDGKMERNQAVLEAVIAEVQEEVEGKVAALRSDLEHHERLVEAEVMRLEQYAEDQCAKVQEALATAVTSLTAEIDATKAQLTTTAKELRTEMAAIKSFSEAGIAAAMAALEAEKVEIEAGFLAAAASLAAQKAASKAAQDALAESVTQFVAEAEERHHDLANKVDGQLKTMQAEVTAKLAAAGEELRQHLATFATTKAACEKSLADAAAQLADHKAATDKALTVAAASAAQHKAATDAALTATTEALVAHEAVTRSSLKDMGQSLSKHVATTEAALAALEASMTQFVAEAEEAQKELANKVAQDIAGLTAKVENDMASLTTKVEKDIAGLTSKVDKSVAELTTKLDKSVAELTSKLDKSVADLQADVDAQVNALSDELERQAAQQTEAVKEVKASCDAGLAEAQRQLDQEKAATEAGFSAAAEALGELKVTTRDALAAAAEVAERSRAEADAKLAAALAGFEKQSEALRGELAAALEQQGSALSEQLQAQEDRLGQQVAQVEQQSLAVKDSLAATTAELAEKAEALKRGVDSAVAKVTKDVDAKLGEQSKKADETLAAAVAAQQELADEKFKEFTAKSAETQAKFRQLSGEVEGELKTLAAKAAQQVTQAEALQKKVGDAEAAVAASEKKTAASQKAAQEQQEAAAKRVVALEKAQQEAAAELGPLREKATELNGRIAEMSTRATELNGRVAELSTRALELNGRVSDMGTRVDNTNSALLVAAQSTDAKIKKLTDQLRGELGSRQGTAPGGGSDVKSAVQEAKDDLRRQTERMIRDSGADTVAKVSDVTSNLIDQQLKKFRAEFSQEVDQKIRQAAGR